MESWKGKRSSAIRNDRQVRRSEWLPGISGLGVNALQGATADARFGEALGAGVQSGETLIQAKIVRCLRQRPISGPESLGRHVVGNEKFGSVSAERTARAHCVGIMLVNRRTSGFEFVDDDGGFLGGNQLSAEGPPSWLTTCW